jgi:hypothetical protein
MKALAISVKRRKIENNALRDVANKGLSVIKTRCFH